MREVRDAEALEQLADAARADEGDVALDREVREERVLLETRPTERSSAGTSVQSSPHVTLPRDGRTSPAIARSRVVFPATRRPDERDRLAGRDVERYVEVEGAERNGDVNA